MTSPQDARVVGSGGASQWLAALDFAELCELGARFVLGELDYFPGWGAPTMDEESDRIRETLVRANRSGFFTLASQRGHSPRPGADGRLERRRAFVLGFADEAAGRALRRCAESGLEQRSFGATERGGQSLPVGVREGECFMAVGEAVGQQELDIFSGQISEPALEALQATRYTVLVDPVWERDHHLWSVLSATL